MLSIVLGGLVMLALSAVFSFFTLSEYADYKKYVNLRKDRDHYKADMEKYADELTKIPCVVDNTIRRANVYRMFLDAKAGYEFALKQLENRLPAGDGGEHHDAGVAK